MKRVLCRIILNEFVWIFIAGFFIGKATGMSAFVFEANLKESGQYEKLFSNFFSIIYAEKSYETIYLQGRLPEHCLISIFTKRLIPVIISKGRPIIYIKRHFNSDILAILCVDYLHDENVLEDFALNLQHIRDSRVIIFVSSDLRTKAINDIESFLKSCEKLKLPNVIIVNLATFKNGNYYSYTQFPTFKVEHHNWSRNGTNGEKIFPNRLRNMYGKVLLTLPDQIEPRSMLYTDKTGVQQLSGYIGKLVRTFAEHYNCTLKFPYNIPDDFAMFLSDIRRATQNETIDFGTSLSSAQTLLNIHEFTYPIEIASWLTMLPVEKPLPIHTLLFELILTLLPVFVIESFLLGIMFGLERTNFTNYRLCWVVKFILNSCFNKTILRGLLGLPFLLVKKPNYREKLNYILLFFAGFYFCTSFGAYFVKLLTVPTTEPPIISFDDALRRGLRVIFAEPEIPGIIQWMGNDSWMQYQPLFKIVKTYNELQHYRSTMNTTYAYTITTSTWPMIEAQQQYFKKKLFRLSTELCYVEVIQFSLPLYENSIYKAAFNPFILRIHENGLLSHWFSMTFYDMVALKRISFRDLSNVHKQETLTFEDLYFVWTSYVVFMVIACFVFIYERFWMAKNYIY